MSSDLTFLLISLLSLDVVLFIALFEGYSRNKRIFRLPKVETPDQAFAFFERSYKQLFSEEQDGFTWQEAIEKSNIVLDLPNKEWIEVQNLVKEYEALRYGGIQSNKIDTYPILKLAMSLREKQYLS